MPIQSQSIRGAEMPQRQPSSARVPLQLRTSSSDSDSSQHRPIPDRSPKLLGGVDRRVSPRSVQSGTVNNQRKLGTRIADLETQLGQAQNELKNLKGQLVSAEAAKNEAQELLKKKKTTLKKKKKPLSESSLEKITPLEVVDDAKETDEADAIEVKKKKPLSESNLEKITPLEVVDDVKEIDEADANEVLVEKVMVVVEPEIEVNEEPLKQETEPESLDSNIEEVILLKNQLEEKEKEMEEVRKENELLKKEISEANTAISTAHAKEEEMSAKMNQMEEEIKRSSQVSTQLKEKLEAVERAKEELELEMKKMRVQTEQWRKAADAAAAVLAGDMEMKCRVAGRCSSMDKHFGGSLDISGSGGGGYGGFVGTLGDNEIDEEGGKRKMKFGDLWKRKGQK